MSRRYRRLNLWWVAAIAGFGLLAPGSVGAKDPAAPRERDLTVFAAASLRDAFGKLAQVFERSYPGVHVRFNFAGSQELRVQLKYGAPADVFASADFKQFENARSSNLVGSPRVFATNDLVIVVPKDNPTKLTGLSDLTRARRLVIGAPEVPIGAYTLQVLDKANAKYGPDFRARVEAKAVSRELNCRQILAKVALGEADAGIVYRTDVLAAGDKVRVIPVPGEFSVVAEYPIATTTRPVAPELAHAWVELVTGAKGQQTLAEFGFGSGKR